MGRPDECSNLIHEGKTPSQIAQQLNISISSVIQYLYTAIGNGSLLMTDIVFSIPQEVRSSIDLIILESATDKPSIIGRKVSARQIKIDKEDLRLYLLMRGEIMGDLYFYVTDLEKTLHTLFEEILKDEYGHDDGEWWRLGIPEKVRVECVQRKEMDVYSNDHPYCYTDFIHLKLILEKKWNLFSKHLPKAERKDKQGLLQAMVDANIIRNKVMHPIRNKMANDSDFKFIEQLRLRLEKNMWNISRIKSSDDS